MTRSREKAAVWDAWDRFNIEVHGCAPPTKRHRIGWFVERLLYELALL